MGAQKRSPVDANPLDPEVAAQAAMEARLREIYQQGKSSGIIKGLEIARDTIGDLREQTRKAMLLTLPKDDPAVTSVLQGMDGARDAVAGVLVAIHANGGRK